MLLKIVQRNKRISGGSKTNNYHFHHYVQITSHPVTKSFKSKSKGFTERKCADHFKEYKNYADALFEERNWNSRSTRLAEMSEELLNPPAAAAWTREACLQTIRIDANPSFNFQGLALRLPAKLWGSVLFLRLSSAFWCQGSERFLNRRKQRY